MHRPFTHISYKTGYFPMISEVQKRVEAHIAGTGPDDWRELASKTGLKFAWIRAFAEGRILHPSNARLETLLKAYGEVVTFKAA